jgi:hypothetical protein
VAEAATRLATTTAGHVIPGRRSVDIGDSCGGNDL